MSDTPRCEHEIMEVHYAARHWDENEKGAFEFCVGYDFARQLERELSAMTASRDQWQRAAHRISSDRTDMTKQRDEWKEAAGLAGRQCNEQADKLTARAEAAEQLASEMEQTATTYRKRLEAAEARLVKAEECIYGVGQQWNSAIQNAIIDAYRAADAGKGER